MTSNPSSAAIAAFDICESLLLALVDLKILTTPQVITVLQDVAEVHRNAPPDHGPPHLHREAADRVERLIRARVPKA